MKATDASGGLPEKPTPTLPVRRARGWVDRIDRALFRFERGVRRSTGRVLQWGWALAWLTLAVTGLAAAGALLLHLPGQVLASLEGFYTVDVLERVRGVAMAGITAAVGLFEASVAVALAGLAGRVGLAALGEEELPALPSRVHVDEVEAEALDLHGRPGLLVRVQLLPDAVRPGERLELLARLRTPEGGYLPSGLPAFRGEAGELRVRSLTSTPELDSSTAYLEMALFLPLRAAVLPAGDWAPDDEVRAVVEVLAFSGGIFQDQAEVPVRFAAGRTAAPPPELASEADVEILAEALAAEWTETRCGVCGDPFDAEVVHCAHCETPHHRGCWDFLGRCSTFACDGTAAAPAPPSEAREPARLSPRPLARAELRRRSPVRIVEGGEPTWRVICERCEDVVFIDGAGDCLRCGRPLLRDLPVQFVPATPPGLLESPAVAYPLAAAAVLAPWAFFFYALFVLPAPMVGGLLAGILAIAGLRPRPTARALRLPLEVAGRLMVGVLRNEGPRAYTEDVEIRSVAAEDGALFEGGGFGIRVRFLVKRLARHRVETILRLRTTDGRYLEPPPEHAEDPRLRGIYGELRVRHLGDPGTTDRPLCHEVRFDLPEPPCALPAGVREATLVAEVLCAVDGRVLAEHDQALRYLPRPGVFSEQADPDRSVTSADRVLDPRREHPGEVGASRCPCCGDPLGAYSLRCQRCAHRSHQECWTFLDHCRSCGCPDAVASATQGRRG